MGAFIDILQFFGILLLVVLVFNLLIIVHEWGHFLAARWRGLKVDRFQIWFGKPIWKKTINGVQYGLGSIPAGGFVALPQMAPMEAIEGKNSEDAQPRNLPPIGALDKIIVAFAGPLFSFLLAIVFALVVFLVGKPEAQAAQSKVVGWVFEESPGEAGGFKPGDEIVSVNGHKIERFHGIIDSVDWNFITSEKTKVPVTINRPGVGEMELFLSKDLKELREVSAGDKKAPWYRKAYAYIFRRSALPDSGMRGAETPMIAKLYPNSPAELAGLMPSDVILEINGETITSRFQVSGVLRAKGTEPSEITFRRGKEIKTVTVTPRIPDKRPDDEEYNVPVIGIPAWDEFGDSELAYPTPIEQVSDGVRVIGSTLKAVFSPNTGVNAGHLSGPVGIMRLYYRLFEHPDGWRLVLWFSVILNINLAILNMLPFPVLDGGHITMAGLEWLRRKPINFKVLEMVQTACVIALLGFMIFVTLKDTGDLFGGGGEPPDIGFDPPSARVSPEPAQSNGG